MKDAHLIQSHKSINTRILLLTVALSLAIVSQSYAKNPVEYRTFPQTDEIFGWIEDLW